MFAVPSDLGVMVSAILEVASAVVQEEVAGLRAAPKFELPEFELSEWMKELIDRAGLRTVDVKLLRVLLTCETEPDAYRALQRLAGDPTQPGVACDALVVAMRAFGIDSIDVLHALRPNAPLVERGLVAVHGDERVPPLVRRITLPARVVDYVLTGASPPALGYPLLLVEPAHLLGDLCPVQLRDESVGAAVAEPLRRALLAVRSGEPLWLAGVTGSGRKTLLAALAAELDFRLLVVSCEDAISALASLGESLVSTLWREVLLDRAILCLANADARLAHNTLVGDAAVAGGAGADPIAALYGVFRRARLPMVITSDQPPSTQEFEQPPQIFRLGTATPADTLALWRAKLPNAEDLEEIATQFKLGPGPIVRAAEAARKIADSRGRKNVLRRDVAQAITVSVAQQVAVLGNLVEDNHSWDDIVLPGDTRDSIRELIARVRHRHTVLDEWGFRNKMSKGLGMAALFSGPPGTGKTMVAGIIARELGQELYQIDLSRVVSKWVGETEKNLARVFDAAEGANVLLLFDEADSLFSKRTEVKSSNDRHSNSEINYLLQRVERFEGVCILTTNSEGSIDPAFRRRLAFRMLFPIPDEAERSELWQRMMPATADVASDVAFDELGRDYELSGGNIRNVVLRAAFLAASEKQPINREMLLRAVRLEYRDAGKFTATGRMA